ncbi:alpha/beta fold hydrolase [Umezakia ovalisporum]|jgi:pimeloyl-ACP methyl ester carboxylesterase|uniref:Alpha/beta hydrolase n=2 Tax=Umezakia ovalisporum TaxID=75695 RepID=A0AA43KFL5_9CYAN|nr:alpha/beta hydrolase [Umezakia ovalisporum]MBI1240711.1 alpha/beta fold hydrolase [Nostoc sp. RI_552]MDH6058309.1 alpha/beta hydrolase [Umezakia ovalisporum FSS-43]MDH6064350.1 alpha/beta hydrolase [Umezakia ovalisporum FSS-62]MDH6067964.1 alpha/beta hydrolase [Umezakia ovalisporum APH033B]MDH6071456.1 alpha/beta hydrolase [Umezakia ovalisporum CobakiLakeA]
MLEFQPPGFGHKVIHTSLGPMVYYTQTTAPWLSADTQDLPPLLFLHNFGGGASAFEWSKVYPAFAATHQVLAPDLIGWGESAHPVRDYQIRDYLTTTLEFITQTCGQPVTVVASSFTAALAIRLAISDPHLFRSLFLVCPSGFDDFGQGAGRRLPLPIINSPLLGSLIYTLGAENEIAVTNFLQNFLFAKPERVSTEIVRAYLTSAQQPNAKFSALAFLRGDLYFDLSLYIRQLKTPTVILWGEKAQFTTIKLGRRLANLNTTAIRAFYAMANTGILPHLENPEVVIALLLRSLKTCL